MRGKGGNERKGRKSFESARPWYPLSHLCRPALAVSACLGAPPRTPRALFRRPPLATPCCAMGAARPSPSLHTTHALFRVTHPRAHVSKSSESGTRSKHGGKCSSSSSGSNMGVKSSSSSSSSNIACCRFCLLSLLPAVASACCRFCLLLLLPAVASACRRFCLLSLLPALTRLSGQLTRARGDFLAAMCSETQVVLPPAACRLPPRCLGLYS